MMGLSVLGTSSGIQHNSQPSLETPSLYCLLLQSVPHNKQSFREEMLSQSTSCVLFLFQGRNVVEVPGNHFVHLNEPETVAGSISTFLTAHDARARL
uniref:Uncharacterized protein n=1 Tax=Nothoprocta perdicaria TaxID=30464 RepID=A0A8C6Z6F3_NOTPE